MGFFDTQIATLLSGDLFRQILANQPISLYKFNFLTNMLVNSGIPFDIAYDSGSRKEAAALELTIHINPSATLVLVVALEPGSTVFAPSP